SPFVLSKQTESQLADFTQLFFGQALSTVTMHTPRGPMVQVDLKTYRAYGASPVLRLVEDKCGEIAR
ncbi:hypothetical protein ACC713_35140, partial [Rhizobium johnstonii]